ncbi:MAG: ORF6N domain-containing protein [Bacteroidales bacterium]|jgi:hypothetical protein|nr:ORF6N domain-containing protein [Bacteroidales bacterium]
MKDEIIIYQANQASTSFENLIFTIRDQQVMLDFHLSQVYNLETKRLNEQVKRNLKRFPDSFMFQLNQTEWEILRSQFATAKRRTLPFAFTEQGVAMLSSVLNSDYAIQVSIQIMKAFVNMRKFLLNNASIFQRLDRIESKQLQSDEKIDQIFKALDAKTLSTDKGIFFNGQVFDAYIFFTEIIKKAKHHIILIDNYIDESVLLQLSKRNPNVTATIYTGKISQQLSLDLDKHNKQYPPIEIKQFSDSHDRFIIIDHSELYHIGASLKDLGKKWFAFSRMDSMAGDLLKKLERL